MIKAVQRTKRAAKGERTRALPSMFLARSGSKGLPFPYVLLSAELAKRRPCPNGRRGQRGERHLQRNSEFRRSDIELNGRPFR